MSSDNGSSKEIYIEEENMVTNHEFEKFQKIAQMNSDELRDLKVVVAKYEGQCKIN